MLVSVNVALLFPVSWLDYCRWKRFKHQRWQQCVADGVSFNLQTGNHGRQTEIYVRLRSRPFKIWLQRLVLVSVWENQHVCFLADICDQKGLNYSIIQPLSGTHSTTRSITALLLPLLTHMVRCGSHSVEEDALQASQTSETNQWNLHTSHCFCYPTSKKKDVSKLIEGVKTTFNQSL